MVLPTATAVSVLLLLLCFVDMEALDVNADIETFLRQVGPAKSAGFVKEVVALLEKIKVHEAAASPMCAYIV